MPELKGCWMIDSKGNRVPGVYLPEGGSMTLEDYEKKQVPPPKRSADKAKE